MGSQLRVEKFIQEGDIMNYAGIDHPGQYFALTHVKCYQKEACLII